MADSDLSRIVNLIMENPALIEQIKGLANGGENKTALSEPASLGGETVRETASVAEEYTETVATPSPKVRRRELLCALKPYVSEKRGQAIDSMLSIVDILDVMRSK
ncbi:MAG: hypothetical protein J6V09_00685 [Clostridia bacterium]|nr:hypothetical protein [Clostridia bacterium]